MASVLQLILRSRKEGDAAKKTAAELKKVQQSSDKAAKSLNKLNLAAMAVVGGTIALVGSSIKLAARVEMLGVVTAQLGKTAGLTEEEIRNLEKAIQDQGITAQASRVSLARMIQANIDLADSTDLARLSQDAAVIAGINSSEAFEHLINVIVTGNIRMGRTIGLQLQFGRALQQTAKQLGKTTAELTEQEIIQARTDDVLRQGAAIAGTYEAAMETAGKQLLSLNRYIEEFKVALGDLFLPALGAAVDGLTEFFKTMREGLIVTKQLVDQNKELAMIFKEHNTEMIKVSKSYKDYTVEMQRAAGVADKTARTLEEINALYDAGLIVDVARSYRVLSESEWEAVRATESMDEGLFRHEEIMLGMKNPLEEAAESTWTYTKALGGAAEAVKKVERATSTFWGVLGEGPGVISALESNLEAIDYAEAGALAIEKTREGVERAAAAGIITQEQADTMFAELYTAAQQIEIELGNITAYEAAKNIRDNVGTPIGEARTAVDNLEADLVSLVQKELTLQIRIEYIGEPTGFQQGGSFIVRGPPGPDRVPVQFMATSGERVTVTPAGQTFDQRDQRQFLQGAQMNFNREIDEDVFLEQIRRIAS